jgi:aminomuconate-semialdehyde/2-hydroxymuconate-6-semialdehyde dehydrogenase
MVAEQDQFKIMKRLLNYINGRLIEPASGIYLPVIEPATGVQYAEVPDSGASDIHLATEAASSALELWSSMPAMDRCRIMEKIADLIDRDKESLALAESKDNGKPVSLARTMDIPRASENFRFFATAIMHMASEAHLTGKDAVNYTHKAPVGVAGCISPWNLPLYLFTWKIAPALAAGCTVVAKPSELTPMTAFMLSEICMEAGLPPGVLNIVHGSGTVTGQAIIEHPRIKAISFTGGTVTGKKIAATAAPMFKKLSLELGGKNPNIIFADCDFETALATSVRSSFTNQGEICLCGSRILVERSIYEKFTQAFSDRVKQLTVGDPMNEKTSIGALVSRTHLEKVMGYVDLAVQEGGTILTGGRMVEPEGRCKNGFFMEPTVITGLKSNCRTNREEIFGPVVTIMPFDTEAEAIRIANDSDYGLAATIWTENLKKAHRVAAEVRCGIIWVNCWLLRDLRTPFGGMNQSGVGREGGWEALRFFTEQKNICIRL